MTDRGRLSDSERAHGRMLDAADATQFIATEDGVWCPECGSIVAAPWHFEDEGYLLRDICKDCGFPHD